jgi:hypothetical protein
MKLKRYYYVIAGAVALLGLGIALYFFKSRTDRRSETASDHKRRVLSAFEDPTRELREMALQTQVPYADVLSDFKIWSQYPQDSRPLSRGDVDVLNFGKIELPFMPMPVIENGKPKEPVYSCVLQPNAHTAYENEDLETHLRCQETQSGKFALADIRTLKLTRTAGTGIFDVPLPDVRKNEKAPVSVVFVYRPRPQDWGDMELSVDFLIPEEKSSFIHRLKVHFFSSPEAPAKFLGKFNERIDNGSLIISAEINVRKPGPYRIEGILTTEDGQPIGHARVDSRLGGGSQWVDLLFFGKIFHDKGIPGPYKLAALHGAQQNLPISPEALTGPPDQVDKLIQMTEQTEPIKRSMLPWQGDYRTFAYTLKTFSFAEYDSEFKRERISELEKLAAGK